MSRASANIRDTGKIPANAFDTAEETPAPAVPIMPDYLGRTLGYAAMAVIMVAGIIEGHHSVWLYGMAGFAIVWPHLAQLFSLDARKRNSPTIRQQLLLIDSAISGAFIGSLGLVSISAATITLMVMFTCFVVGGLKQWAMGSLILFASALAVFFLFNPDHAITLPPHADLLAVIVAGVYICATALFSHQQAKALRHATLLIQTQREQSIALSKQLSKYMSPQVWQTIFTGQRDVRLETQRKKLAVFFSDIQGFTELSEEMEPEALTDVLNHYFNEMSQIALKHGGTIDKFVGDSIMIFFGDPTSLGQRADTLACVSMAIDMRKHMKILRQKWRSQGIKTPLQIRMGISTGYATVGNFGAANRMDYTIIGKEVNLASRLEHLAEPGEILVTHEAFSLIKDGIMCRDKGEVTVKGFSRPIAVYQVIDYRCDLGRNRSFLEHEHSGFTLYLDSAKVNENDRIAILRALDEASSRLRHQRD
ncbi:MAG: adenylate/guanylate cyclase domain-containing protein [Marinobacter sp.]